MSQGYEAMDEVCDPSTRAPDAVNEPYFDLVAGEDGIRYACAIFWDSCEMPTDCRRQVALALAKSRAVWHDQVPLFVHMLMTSAFACA